MMTLTLVLGLALLLTGFGWLVVSAFRTGLGWGVAVLLFPPAGLAFAAVHRQPSQGPLILAAGGVGVFVLLATAEAAGPALGKPVDVEARMGSGRLPAAGSMAFEAPPPQATAERSEPCSPAAEPLDLRQFETGRDEPLTYASSLTDGFVGLNGDGELVPLGAGEPDLGGSETAEMTARGGYDAVAVENAGRFAGAEVEIVTRRGERLQGVLVEARGDEILFESYVGSGTITYPLALERISELRVAG